MRKIPSYIYFLFFVGLTIFGSYSCANMAAPTGGLYDEDPPEPRRASPDFNALNVTKNKIEIEFNENIKIEKPLEKVIITPPQRNMPVISAIGRRAVVELRDTLIENTTYTIDFTDAIVDNNEGNPIENFSISFSTGNELDTLAVSGTALEAKNLEPIQGLYIGIHSNDNDSAFTKTPFERISRTDSRGRFTVRGLKEGKYRIFALDDKNRDYMYDNPQESIAFLDSLIIPSTTPAVRQDTIFNAADSTVIDSIKQINYTRFLPDDIVMRVFLSDFQRKYMQKTERPAQHKLNIMFGSPTGMPTFQLLNPEKDLDDDSWYVLERSARNDTLTFWITDSAVIKQDSIRMKLNYLQTDTLNQDFIATDTLNFNYRAPREPRRRAEAPKDNEEKSEPEIQFLNIKSNIQATFEIFNPIRIEFDQPVVEFDSTQLKLFREEDSLFVEISRTIIPDTLNPRRLTLLHKWDAGQKYKMEIDSAAITSHYGLWNNKFEQTFTIKKLEDYGNMQFTIIGLPEAKDAYVEVLDKSDNPIRRVKVRGNIAKLQDLLPGTIYFRLFIDENKDGEWTTGNYEQHRQPEEVYYYPKSYEIRAFSDYFEDWDLNALLPTKQKPEEITKQKPEEKKRRNLNQQNQQRQGGNQRTSSSPTNTEQSTIKR